jgi:hypothetical protein
MKIVIMGIDDRHHMDTQLMDPLHKALNQIYGRVLLNIY